MQPAQTQALLQYFFAKGAASENELKAFIAETPRLQSLDGIIFLGKTEGKIKQNLICFH